MRQLLASILLVVFTTTAYAGDDKPLVVVELYTSEGCASCPPAEKILSKLAKRDDVLALSLHVDYWDYLGWKDPFALAKFTDRQEYYNMAFGNRYRMVTPEMVFQGQSYVAGAKPEKITAALEKLSNTPDDVTLTVERLGGRIRVKIAPRDVLVSDPDVFLVQYKPSQTTKVKSGENRGRTLDHTNTVTAWDLVGVWSGEVDWFIDQPLADGVSAAVIVQAPDNGPILAARKLQ
ncbi:MAG: DUF1223 domain-containing protein [Rhodobacterales bacterium]